MATAIGPDHRRLSRARLYAAGSASAKVIATPTSPTQTVFQTKVRKAVSWNRYRMWSNVGSRLKTNGVFSGL